MTYKNNEKSVTRGDSEKRNPSYTKNTLSFITKHIDPWDSCKFINSDDGILFDYLNLRFSIY